MTQYIACQDDDTDPNSWYITTGGWSLGLTLNESEASVIAFALNAVADGYSLWRITRHPENADYSEPYMGPTEGIAS